MNILFVIKCVASYIFSELMMNYKNIKKINRLLSSKNKFIENLKKTITDLEKKRKEKGKITSNIEVNIKQDVSVNTKYIIYIQKYGVPFDGIFDSDLLKNL